MVQMSIKNDRQATPVSWKLICNTSTESSHSEVIYILWSSIYCIIKMESSLVGANDANKEPATLVMTIVISQKAPLPVDTWWHDCPHPSLDGMEEEKYWLWTYNEIGRRGGWGQSQWQAAQKCSSVTHFRKSTSILGKWSQDQKKMRFFGRSHVFSPQENSNLTGVSDVVSERKK